MSENETSIYFTDGPYKDRIIPIRNTTMKLTVMENPRHTPPEYNDGDLIGTYERISETEFRWVS
jgi:hypothetical protein